MVEKNDLPDVFKTFWQPSCSKLPIVQKHPSSSEGNPAQEKWQAVLKALEKAGKTKWHMNTEKRTD
ncbi:hypothetical protein [Desertibacillus haloalkaliphilus]|uniref:hypothetical protein n=1 Tax=Desertibacillus haloalkaliphilus TaxID=1328930 RepID=UPI001C27DAF6|nr:hypothetical protein [Desertibacillus haloalkaliphilus]MBU8908362.1 hypothetical protein [Desertibacillus haloalkaliphilus]